MRPLDSWLRTVIAEQPMAFDRASQRARLLQEVAKQRRQRARTSVAVAVGLVAASATLGAIWLGPMGDAAPSVELAGSLGRNVAVVRGAPPHVLLPALPRWAEETEAPHRLSERTSRSRPSTRRSVAVARGLSEGEREQTEPEAPPQQAFELTRTESRTAAWRSALERADEEQAYRLLFEEGPDASLTSASAQELMRLARVARKRRDGDRAIHLLEEVRRRGQGGPEASRATYLLGRVHEDLLREPEVAAHWYTTYTREYPNAPLSTEARGRAMRCLARAGLLEAARAQAQYYLDADPEGLHAEWARRLLSGARPP